MENINYEKLKEAINAKENENLALKAKELGIDVKEYHVEIEKKKEIKETKEKEEEKVSGKEKGKEEEKDQENFLEKLGDKLEKAIGKIGETKETKKESIELSL